MLGAAVGFLIIAMIAGILGFTNVMFVSIEFAKIVFFIFLILFVISFILHLFRGKGGGGML